MKYKSYWGFKECEQTAPQETNNIFGIMDHQCKELLKYTQGNVFGIFDEIKTNGSLVKTANMVATVLKSVSGVAEITESIGEISTKDLIDADGMYWKKRFAFEICTEKYRFRVFSMLITPVFPVVITINAGVCKNIFNRIVSIVKPVDEDNSFLIENEEVFCSVLQEILADKKVLYIVSELTTQGMLEHNTNEKLPEKVIICEGRTDEVILHAIAQKLNKRVTIITSNGGYNIPKIFSSVKHRNTQTKILIVVDSDGDENCVKTQMENSIGQTEYELAIINNSIEDWFAAEVSTFSKLKLMQSIGAILEETDFDELSKKHKSFHKVVCFLTA